MMTLEERAKSYAMQVGCFRPDLCAADYVAGAKEERILLIEKACRFFHEHFWKHPHTGLICAEWDGDDAEFMDEFVKYMEE